MYIKFLLFIIFMSSVASATNINSAFDDYDDLELFNVVPIPYPEQQTHSEFVEPDKAARAIKHVLHELDSILNIDFPIIEFPIIADLISGTVIDIDDLILFSVPEQELTDTLQFAAAAHSISYALDALTDITMESIEKAARQLYETLVVLNHPAVHIPNAATAVQDIINELEFFSDQPSEDDSDDFEDQSFSDFNDFSAF